MSPPLLMVALIAALFLLLKPLATLAAGNQIGAARWSCFALAWPGMNPAPFARAFTRALPGSVELAARGVRSLAIGLWLYLLARLLWREGHPLLATALFLPAFSFSVHFGLFALLAAAWRRLGVNVRAPFAAPFLSTTLSDFWGRRWNRPFVELTTLLVHRPLAARLGPRAALVAAFLFSGLLHELAISAPVNAGWGLPTLYFALQALAIGVERRFALSGHAWTIACVVLPAPLLFHPPFLAGVVWPLLG